jgi:hypothetical protein
MKITSYEKLGSFEHLSIAASARVSFSQLLSLKWRIEDPKTAFIY